MGRSAGIRESHHLLVNRARRLQNKIIAQDIQNPRNSTIATQYVATFSRTNLSRGRLHMKDRQRRTSRLSGLCRPRPQTHLLFIIEERRPAPITRRHFIRSGQRHCHAATPYQAPAPLLAPKTFLRIQSKTGRYQRQKRSDSPKRPPTQNGKRPLSTDPEGRPAAHTKMR